MKLLPLTAVLLLLSSFSLVHAMNTEESLHCDEILTSEYYAELEEENFEPAKNKHNAIMLCEQHSSEPLDVGADLLMKLGMNRADAEAFNVDIATFFHD